LLQTGFQPVQTIFLQTAVQACRKTPSVCPNDPAQTDAGGTRSHCARSALTLAGDKMVQKEAGINLTALTDRHRELVDLALERLSDKAIARRPSVSDHTAGNHSAPSMRNLASANAATSSHCSNRLRDSTNVLSI
jgi:DNA-binding NarL/FixJ family response regulator